MAPTPRSPFEPCDDVLALQFFRSTVSLFIFFFSYFFFFECSPILEITFFLTFFGRVRPPLGILLPCASAEFCPFHAARAPSQVSPPHVFIWQLSFLPTDPLQFPPVNSPAGRSFLLPLPHFPFVLHPRYFPPSPLVLPSSLTRFWNYAFDEIPQFPRLCASTLAFFSVFPITVSLSLSPLPEPPKTLNSSSGLQQRLIVLIELRGLMAFPSFAVFFCAIRPDLFTN